MDINWLEKNSFLERDEIQSFFIHLNGWHFNNGYEWMGVVVDKFSDLAPKAREIFWEELVLYANKNINFQIDYVLDEINKKLKEYPLLQSDPQKASIEISNELWKLWNRFYYNPKVNPRFRKLFTISSLYDEIRWILGQILATFPDIIDVNFGEAGIVALPSRYNDLDSVYHIVEFLVKILSDSHIYYFFIDNFPEAFAALLEGILNANKEMQPSSNYSK